MEHRRTNEKQHEAEFLGMLINTEGDSVKLRLKPKGAGWCWKPQRYVEWSSIHTSHTKKFLLKGLLVRAGTVTNTTEAFHEAVEYFVQGLHARSFQEHSLKHSFESYLHDYWSALPNLANDLRTWFNRKLLPKYYPTKASSPKQDPPKSVHGTLLCGLRAINHVLQSRGRPEAG